MNTNFNKVASFVLTVILTACATEEELAGDTSKTGVQTEENIAVNEQGNAATSVTISRVTAEVKIINPVNRMVTLVGPKGNEFTVQAGKAVKNLEQVEVGDKVVVEYYKGFVADLNPSGSSTEIISTEAMARAQPGERPAGALGNAVTATVVIQEVDTKNNLLSFNGPLGGLNIVEVNKPEIRELMKNLRPGDEVALTFFEALAVSVQPANK